MKKKPKKQTTKNQTKTNAGIKNNIKFQSLNFLISPCSLNGIQKSSVRRIENAGVR